MQIATQRLIDELIDITNKCILNAKQLKTLDEATLNRKENATQWSMLECLEHLNLYGDFYLPEIEKRMTNALPTSNNLVFKSGWLGNYFAKLMKPAKDGSIKKMKSPKDKNPANSALSVTTVDRFIKQLEKLQQLLQQARHIDLTKTKTAISLTNLIQLRLGDTFRFVVYHIERHVQQANRIKIADKA